MMGHGVYLASRKQGYQRCDRGNGVGGRGTRSSGDIRLSSNDHNCSFSVVILNLVMKSISYSSRCQRTLTQNLASELLLHSYS